MDSDFLMILVIAIIFGIAYSAIKKILQNNYQNKLFRLLQEEKYDELFKELGSVKTKYFIPRFNAEYLKANAYILKGDDDGATKQFDFLLNMRCSKVQRKDVLTKAFNYHVSMEHKQKSKEVLELIKEFNDENMTNEAQIMYDIYIMKKANHIDELLATLDSDEIPLQGKAVNEFLISLQYLNKEDEEKSKFYLEESKKHMKEAEEQMDEAERQQAEAKQKEQEEQLNAAQAKLDKLKPNKKKKKGE